MRPCVLLLLGLTIACDQASSEVEVGDERDDSFSGAAKADGGIDEGSPEALGVLRVANTTDFEALDVSVSSGGVGLLVTAAENIVARRAGPDGLEGTQDDVPFTSLAELDAVSWVGPVALARMLDFADRSGFIEEAEPPQPWWHRSMRMPGPLGEAPEGSDVRDTCLVLANQDDRYTLPVRLPEPGTYDVFVNAYQDAAGDEPARMLVSLDGEAIAEFDVTALDGDWDVHHVQTTVGDADGEPRSLEVSFLNDGQSPDADRDLVLCGVGVDNLGTATYPGVPEGRVRGHVDLDVDTIAYDTSHHNWIRVGDGDVPTRCIAKGHNPGRILWDCSFDAYAMHSNFAPYSIPQALQIFRGFAPPPFISTGASRTSGVMLERTSAYPGYVSVTLRPLGGGAVAHIDYDLFLYGDYRLQGMNLDVPVVFE